MKNKGKVIALAIALVVVMSAFVVYATKSPVSGDQGLKGNDGPGNDPVDDTPLVPTLTTIAASMTAVGYWENIISYDWTLEKVVGGALAQEDESDIPIVQIEPGESVDISFDITVERSGPIYDETDGARGVAVVSNTGSNPTEDLAISVAIQGLSDGVWVDLASTVVNTAGMPVLAAGEEFAYAYDVAFDGLDLVEFRAIAYVTITNFVDHVDDAYGVDACAEFELPSEKSYVVLNENAYLTDLFCVPEGFEFLVLTDSGPWVLSGEGPWEFNIEYRVANVDATSDVRYILDNQARLSLDDTCEEIISNAQVKVYSGDFEIGLSIASTANVVSWVENAEFELDIDTDDVRNIINTTGGNPLNGSVPVNTTSVLTVDDNNFVIEGTITLTNLGWYATENLKLTYSVYLFNGTEWVLAGYIVVDVSEHPVLEACETWTYSFSMELYIDGTELGSFGSIHVTPLKSVVSASISNLDADADPGSTTLVSPLFLPMKQDVLTVVTKASYVNENIFLLPMAGENAWIRFQNQLYYEQTLVVTNCDGKTVVTLNTEIHAQTTVTYQCCCIEKSAVLTNDYLHCETAIITGDNKAVVLFDAQVSEDFETLEVCALCYSVDLNLYSVLAYAEGFALYDADGAYVLLNAQALFYGVSASLGQPVMPVDPEPIPV